MNRTNRVVYVDLLRIIGCCMVVMLHAVQKQMDFPLQFFVAKTIEIISEIGVPLFIMISGMFLLDETKNVTSNKIYKSKILKLLLLFFFWNFVCDIFNEGIIERKSFDQLVERFITGYAHLWFLPMLMGLYAITPFLRVWVKRENKKIIQYVLAVSAIFCFTLPMIEKVAVFMGCPEYIFYFFDNINLYRFMNYSTFYIMGWYINTFSIEKEKLWYAVGAISIICMMIGNIGLSFWAKMDVSLFTENTTIFILGYACALVLFMKNHVSNENRFSPVIVKLASLTFGVYLVHLISMELVVWKLNSLPYCAIWFLTLVISFVGVAIASRIPGIKKLVL